MPTSTPPPAAGLDVDQAPPDEATGTATEQDVERADTEAKEAAALVSALEQRVMGGDETVTAQEISSAESLGRFARLRAEATRRKAASAREAARLRSLSVLADEMRARTRDDARYLELLDTIETAVVALVEFSGQRDAMVQGWRSRMHQADVPATSAAPQGTMPAEQGHVGWTAGVIGRCVMVDDAVIGHVEPGMVVMAALRRAEHRTRERLRTGSGEVIDLPHIGDAWTDHPEREIGRYA